MPHQGHALDSIEGFPHEIASKLREELSVNTTEQFVDLSRNHPLEIARLLDLEPTRMRDLWERAAAVIPAGDLNEILHPTEADYLYPTGHDAPVDGSTFYKGESNDD